MASQFSGALLKSYQSADGEVRGVRVSCAVKIEDGGEYRTGKFIVGITADEAITAYQSGLAAPVCAALRRLGGTRIAVKWGKLTDGALSGRLSPYMSGTDVAGLIDGANASAAAALDNPPAVVNPPTHETAPSPAVPGVGNGAPATVGSRRK